MNKRFTIKLIICVYGALLALALISSIFNFISDTVMFTNGTIVTREYTIDDFKLKDFNVTDSRNAVSTSPDPQMILSEYNSRATMLTINFEFSRNPGEICLYYARGYEEFSNSHRAWGELQADGKYIFILPRGNLSRLRLDPTSYENNEIKINSCTLNPKRPFANYFYYSGADIFSYVLYGAFICCIIAFIHLEHQNIVSAGKAFILKLIKRRN